MTPLELLFEIRDRYNLSTRDLAKLMRVRDTTMEKWCAGKGAPSDLGEVIQIEERILWLAAYLKVRPELDEFNETFFKAAINKLDGEENI
jgi:transcriptional regulator with XRE-family HTH domain